MRSEEIQQEREDPVNNSEMICCASDNTCMKTIVNEECSGEGHTEINNGEDIGKQGRECEDDEYVNMEISVKLRWINMKKRVCLIRF